MKYYNFTNLGITGNRKPQNTHLIWELSSGMLYIVDSVDNTKFYYSSDKGDNWTQIDVDPSNSSGDNKSRDHKIRAGWHDRGNSVIWFVDCDNDGTADDFDVWKLDYSGSETAPSITEIGASAGADANTVYAGDIFVAGGNTYVINMEDRAATLTAVVWDVDTAPFTEQNTFVPGDADTAILGYGVLDTANNDYYCPIEFLSGANYSLALALYDYVTDGFAETNVNSDYKFKSGENQIGSAYDDSNLIYFVGENTGDSKTYLITYSISGASMSVLGEYNISLMLDRNTASGVMEKAFHVTEAKVYQIHTTAKHQLHLIAVPNCTTPILAITDNFLITTDP
jgi:hypothetical protein